MGRRRPSRSPVYPAWLPRVHDTLWTTSGRFRRLELLQNGRTEWLHVLPLTPYVRESREHIRRPETASRPLLRAQLRRAPECVCAKRGRFCGRRAAREKRADEAREQVATSAGRETGVAARHDMLGSPQI